jgi:hypothetical protein
LLIVMDPVFVCFTIYSLLVKRAKMSYHWKISGLRTSGVQCRFSHLWNWPWEVKLYFALFCKVNKAKSTFPHVYFVVMCWFQCSLYHCIQILG